MKTQAQEEVMDTEQQLEVGEVRYVVGIDLGTTNSAVAYVDRSQGREVQFLPIPQLVAVGQVAERSVLPSFVYLPGEYELPEGGASLPWSPDREWVAGEFAREQGASVPGRLVSSAKSWLCHGGVDRTGDILPWGSGEEVQKLSPVEASSRYLAHIREVWNHTLSQGRDEDTLENQLVVLTVPASFDEVARELTVRAAQQAGLPRVVLLEEPLAAFYAWLSRHEENWKEGLEPGQFVVVCDVGGGTTDFTVVAVRESEKGEMKFDRLAVGEHLLLGGDNMDLALARHVEHQMTGKTGKLNPRRWHQLVHQCRKAKEKILAEGSEAGRVRIALAGTGSRLIGDTQRGELDWELVQKIILEGFFPSLELESSKSNERRRGLTEWGLPYEQEPAVTRHLANFWKAYRELLQRETQVETPRPNWVLFNGGALTPAIIREKIQGILRDWFPGQEDIAQELVNPRPELAVAIGAAYYGMVRLGSGVRVGAGSPRAYYVEVGTPEKKDEDTFHPGVCLVPRSAEEGFETQLQEPAFQVRANQPVVFRLLNSSTRIGDQLGQVLQLPESEITRLPPIQTLLRFGKKGEARQLPVGLKVRLTEVGTLELWCESQESDHRWRHSFDVRQPETGAEEEARSSGTTLESAVVEQALEKARDVFQNTSAKDRKPLDQLNKKLESILDLKRGSWPTSFIRTLFDALLELQGLRKTSARHESRWLNLAGYCLRPGFGEAVDDWRIRECWKKLFFQGLEHTGDGNWIQWWIFWRRLGGGLTAGQQEQLYHQLRGGLSLGRGAQKGKKGQRRFSSQEEVEAWMALGNFERLSVDIKLKLGRRLVGPVSKGKTQEQLLWVLSRLGSRIPLYGPVERVVPPAEAVRWIESLMDGKLSATPGLARALLQMGRKTGDRARDLPEAAFDTLLLWLEQQENGERLAALAREPGLEMEQQERNWVFGESLPSGLVLASS